MYELVQQVLDRRTHHFTVAGDDNAIVTYDEAIDLLQTDTEFREVFISALAASPFSAYRWETAPVTRATAEKPFEFVLVDSPGLDIPADRQTFERYYASAQDGVAVFDNLGGDAALAVPVPSAATVDYSHLAAFMRNAPQAQVHALWRTVGAVAQDRLSHRPVWISTAGGGVAWLHVRFDSRPKYYSHAPYKGVP